MAQPRPQPKQPYNLNPEPIRWSLVAPFFALLAMFVPIPPTIVEEFYSRDMYPWLQNLFTGVTNFLPFALLDIVLIAVVLATLFRIKRLFFVARQRGIFDALWELFRRVIRLASFVTIFFYWAWGFNYHRVPLESTLPEKSAPKPSLEMLEGAIIDANGLASRLRPLVANGPELGYPEIKDRLKGPLNLALKQLGRPQLEREGRPKYSLLLTPLFTSIGLTGMTNPLGLETIVHPDLLPYERPYVLAHEWAHLSGHADEAEASAIGWLACMRGGNELAYSASLHLIIEASGVLPDEMRRTIMTRVDSGVRADIDAIVARRHNERPAVQKTAELVYDEYLRANHASDGAGSSRRALALILSPSIQNAMAGYAVTR